MGFKIQYGATDRRALYEIVDQIAKDQNGSFEFEATQKKINLTFFGGGVASPQPFSHLIAPISIPKWEKQLKDGRVQLRKKTLKKTSFFSYLELVPLIGSVVGIFSTVTRCFTIEWRKKCLKKAINKWNLLPINAPEKQRVQKGAKVFNEAVKLTNETNLYWGSCSASIPLTKLFLGLMRGVVYTLHNKKEQ